MGSFQARLGRVSIALFVFGAAALLGLTNKNSSTKLHHPGHAVAAEMVAVPADTTGAGPEAPVKEPIRKSGTLGGAIDGKEDFNVPTLSPSMLALLGGGLAAAGLLLLKRG